MTYDKFFSWRAWAVFTALCALSLWYGNQFNKICFLLGLAAIVIMVPGTLRYWKYSLVFDNIRMYCAWLTEHYGGVH